MPPLRSTHARRRTSFSPIRTIRKPGLPELSDILGAAPKSRGPWEESETIAKQRAAREGKPLLIWFTDSARSPMCKALNQELFSTPDFGMWASEKIIRLRVDANVAAANSSTIRTSRSMKRNPAVRISRAMSPA